MPLGVVQMDQRLSFSTKTTKTTHGPRSRDGRVFAIRSSFLTRVPSLCCSGSRKACCNYRRRGKSRIATKRRDHRHCSFLGCCPKLMFWRSNTAIPSSFKWDTTNCVDTESCFMRATRSLFLSFFLPSGYGHGLLAGRNRSPNGEFMQLFDCQA